MLEQLMHMARQYGRITISELESREFIAVIFNDEHAEVVASAFSNDPATALKKAIEIASHNHRNFQESLN